MLGGAELGREGGGGDVAGDEVGLGVGEETWYDGERVPKVCADGLSEGRVSGASSGSGLFANGGGSNKGDRERRPVVSPKMLFSKGELGGASEASWVRVSSGGKGFARWVSRTAASTSGETMGEAGY